MLQDAFALEVSGSYKPFKEVGSGNLAVIMANHGIQPDESKTGSVLAGFAEGLPPHSDKVYLHAAPVVRVEPGRLAPSWSHAWRDLGLTNIVRAVSMLRPS
jgi:hypothetical protein